jgi:uncharacterized protein
MLSYAFADKMSNCDVAIREPNCNIEDLIDVIEGNRVYVPALYVLNKVNLCLFLTA